MRCLLHMGLCVLDLHQGWANVWLDMAPERQEAIQRAAYLCFCRFHVRTGPDDAPNQLRSDAWCNLRHSITLGCQCDREVSDNIIPTMQPGAERVSAPHCTLSACCKELALPAEGSCSSAPDPPQFQRQPLVVAGQGVGPLAEPAHGSAQSEA